MFVSTFVKGEFFVAVSHLWDSLIQIFYLRTRPVPVIIREERILRYPEEPEVDADLIPPLKEILYNISEGVIDPEEAVPLILKSIQTHPEECIDIHQLMSQVDKLVSEEMEKFAKAEEKVRKKLEENKN